MSMKDQQVTLASLVQQNGLTEIPQRNRVLAIDQPRRAQKPQRHYLFQKRVDASEPRVHIGM